MNKPLPKYLIIELPEAFDLLDTLGRDEELPVVDTDSVMQVLLDTFEKKHGCSRRITYTLDWLLEGEGLSSRLLLSPAKKAALRCLFHATLIGMEQDLLRLDPYVEGWLGWSYHYRRGKHAALLARVDHPRG